ncbi:cupin domain-containing protein [Leifsonia aquatica]|uniref:cupin domain-containing protein n=1 Tax=Leifsonia aquatica TaxID=144185 RepID=UPI0037FB6F36
MTRQRPGFTGAVSARRLAAESEDSLLVVYAVAFDPGARTDWHTHPNGQGLYVTDGVAIIEVEGQRSIRLEAGESVWIAPHVRHWHGALSNNPMSHVAYQTAAIDGTTVRWHEPVSDSDYAQAIKEPN